MQPAGKTTLGVGGRIAVRCGLARVVRRFKTDDKGATAVEFGLIAVPFFALMFAILETALAFFAQQLLEEAVHSASRAVRTGQAQQADLTAKGFKDSICWYLAYMFDCQSGLSVDVQTFANFGSITPGTGTLAVPKDGNGNLKITTYNADGSLVTDNGFHYDIGASGQIVVVRAFYAWPVFVNQLGNNLANINGKHLLAATAAFRNEPFPW
jgi:Flp pilus assembly protein TadG